MPVSFGKVLGLGATVLLTLAPAALDGQARIPPDLVGERVRVTVARTGDSFTGTVTSMGPAELMLTESGGDARSIAYSDIDGIERSLGMQYKTWKGLGIGAGVGFALGGLTGVWLSNAVCGSCDPNTGEVFVKLGAVGALVGGLVGSVIGSARSRDRWESAPLGLDASARILVRPAPASHGGWSIGVSLPLDGRVLAR